MTPEDITRRAAHCGDCGMALNQYGTAIEGGCETCAPRGDRDKPRPVDGAGLVWGTILAVPMWLIIGGVVWLLASCAPSPEHTFTYPDGQARMEVELVIHPSAQGVQEAWLAIHPDDPRPILAFARFNPFLPSQTCEVHVRAPFGTSDGAWLNSVVHELGHCTHGAWHD